MLFVLCIYFFHIDMIFLGFKVRPYKVWDLPTDLCCLKTIVSKPEVKFLIETSHLSERTSRKTLGNGSQNLMNENKHKRKKANQWRCNYYRNTTILSVTVTWQTFKSSISFIAVIFLIIPKACHSSYTMAFKIKVIAEAEAVEKNSKIAWD